MPRIHNIDLEGTIQDLKFKGWATDPTEYTEVGHLWYNTTEHVHKVTVGNPVRIEVIDFADWMSQSVTATTTTTTIDLTKGHNISLTLQSNTTINFTNYPTGTHINHVPLEIVQDATGNRSITGFQLGGLAVTPKYAGGTAPTLTGTANSLDKLHIVVHNAKIEVYLIGKDVK